MLFSDLVLEKAILEFRFETTYLFWDNSGRSLAKIVGKFPRFELRDAKLSNVQADWWDEGLIINLGPERADVTVDFPQGLDNYKGVADSLAQVLREFLDVKLFSRVGLRFFYSYPFESKDRARDFFNELHVVVLKPSAIERFLPDGAIQEEQLTVRYENKDRGYAFRLASAERDLKIRVPRPFTLQTDKFKRNAVVFDVDCYTTKSVDPSIFVPADFIRIQQRVLEQNLLSIVGL